MVLLVSPYAMIHVILSLSNNQDNNVKTRFTCKILYIHTTATFQEFVQQVNGKYTSNEVFTAGITSVYEISDAKLPATRAG